MIKEYKIFNVPDLHQLETSVQTSIKEGWQPLGGIVAIREKLNAEYEPDINSKETVMYLQAMVK